MSTSSLKPLLLPEKNNDHQSSSNNIPPIIKHVWFKEQTDRIAEDGTVDQASLNDEICCKDAYSSLMLDDSRRVAAVLSQQRKPAPEFDPKKDMISSYRKFAPRSSLLLSRPPSVAPSTAATAPPALQTIDSCDEFFDNDDSGVVVTPPRTSLPNRHAAEAAATSRPTAVKAAPLLQVVDSYDDFFEEAPPLQALDSASSDEFLDNENEDEEDDDLDLVELDLVASYKKLAPRETLPYIQDKMKKRTAQYTTTVTTTKSKSIIYKKCDSHLWQLGTSPRGMRQSMICCN